MPRKISPKELYHQRKNSGVCVSCGKQKPVPDRVRCEQCLDKDRQENRLKREMLKSLGICARCGKVSVFKGETLCPECRAKHMNAVEQYRRNHPEKYKAMHDVANKKRTDYLRANGICITCGKRKVYDGCVQCSICLIKNQKNTRFDEWR